MVMLKDASYYFLHSMNFLSVQTSDVNLSKAVWLRIVKLASSAHYNEIEYPNFQALLNCLRLKRFS